MKKVKKVKRVKKVGFEDLEQGQFCKYRKQIYLTDDCLNPCSIQLTGRDAGGVNGLSANSLVTPIKVKIVEVK